MWLKMVFSKKLLASLIMAVLLLNISFFLNRSRAAENDLFKSFQEFLGPSCSADDIEASPPASTNDAKVRLRPYLDDRPHGFLAVLRLDSRDVEEDPGTRAASQMMVDAGLLVAVHEIKQYVPDPENQPHLASIDIQNHARFGSELAGFLAQLWQTIQEHKPKVGAINDDKHYAEAREEDQVAHSDGRIPPENGHWREDYTEEPIRSQEYLLYFLRLSGDELRSIWEAHQAFLDAMPQDFPGAVYQLGKLSQFMHGDGIVYLGGGNATQLALTSISMLRATGSALPVEVILPRRSDFDSQLCTWTLPALNARCKIMEEYLPVAMSESVSDHQLRNMALLVSSFQNVLFLDADNIPLKNPDHMFVNEPFATLRMVVWPDLWRRSTSPHFYTVADIQADEEFHMRDSFSSYDLRGKSNDPLQMSFHDSRGTMAEAASEASQLLIDKKRHARTLFLAMYYNTHGPEYYYALLSQGAAGEGDKETFLAAAHKLGLPYYQVSEFIREFGPQDDAGKRQLFGLAQYDPIVDYLESTTPRRTVPFKGPYAKNRHDASVNNYERHFYQSHSLMFLHANWRGLSLEQVLMGGPGGRGMKTESGARRRLYTDDLLHECNGVDIESMLMHYIHAWFCSVRIDMNGVAPSTSPERLLLCTEVEEQIEYLQRK